MGYCNRTLVERIIAQSMTSATISSANHPQKGLLRDFGNQLNTNVIPLDTLNEHISIADQFINSVLSEMYKVPLKEFSDFDVDLGLDIDEYSSHIVLSRPCANVFNPGDVIFITDGNQSDRCTVSSYANENTLTVDQLPSANYSSSDTRILRIKFPEPISITSARLTVSSIYDRYYLSQSQLQSNEFSKKMRELARVDLNNIIHGRVILHGQQRIGMRFANPNLKDRYNLPSGDSDSTRDIPEI
jgi:hypothetical protein